MGTKPIFTDFSANSTPISVKYSFLHDSRAHGCFFFVNLALFGTKLSEPFINKQTYIRQSASYSKITYDVFPLLGIVPSADFSFDSVFS